MNIIDAVKQLAAQNPGKLIQDNASTWEADNLLDAIWAAENESPDTNEYTVTDRAVYLVKDDGYMDSVPIYYVMSDNEYAIMFGDQ